MTEQEWVDWCMEELERLMEEHRDVLIRLKEGNSYE